MSGFEWFLLVVVVIAVPLVVAVVVTLWTLEQARQRTRKNRDPEPPGTEPVKRQATRSRVDSGATAAGAPIGDSGSSDARPGSDTSG